MVIDYNDLLERYATQALSGNLTKKKKKRCFLSYQNGD